MDLLLELALGPLTGILQAWAALLWPSDDPGVRRLQRVVLLFVVVGLLVSLSAVLLAYAQASRFYVPILFAVAYICLIVAGMLGKKIEKRGKARTQRQSS